MNFERRDLSREYLLDIFKKLLKPRMIEEKMLILLRQGKISKWFSGIGQEAISVGSILALAEDEYVLPMHRNLGIFTGRGIPLNRLFAQFQGKMSGFTKGRDRSFHFGSKEHNIIGMISHLGPQLAIADGLALAHKLDKEQKTVLVFSGDGGSSEGDFHEALNVAAVWDLPVIFVIENNGYGLSTPSHEQFKFESFVKKGPAYNIDALSIDGNNVLEVFHTVSEIKESIAKKPRPFILECNTFRMRGHEEASGTKYVPKELMEEWSKKDPIENFQNYLFDQAVLTEALLSDLRTEIKTEIEAGLEQAYAEEIVSFSESTELNDLFAQNDHAEQLSLAPSSDREIRLVDAISEGLKQSMQKYPKSVLMGQDVAEYGGVFKITEGFVEEFGKDRIRNTPLCESAIVGAALGLSIEGRKAIMEMQFADFVSCGFNQIVNNLAKIHWRWGQNADVLIRMPTGAGVGAGPFHSQSNEAWFFHVPGLKIVYPAFPGDAKGLLAASISENNPVLFFEHKALYRSLTGPVAEEYYELEIGKAACVKEGTELSIITYGMGVHWALDYCEQNPNESIEIIDLRTLSPLDTATVYESVRKTNKALVLHEDNLTGGIGAELSALIQENCFKDLDAPVARLGSLDTPVPFSAKLEEAYLANHALASAIKETLAY